MGVTACVTARDYQMRLDERPDNELGRRIIDPKSESVNARTMQYHSVLLDLARARFKHLDSTLQHITQTAAETLLAVTSAMLLPNQDATQSTADSENRIVTALRTA
ncbi:MAG: hypothetical protein WAN46_17575 [Gammaproteobacteria bacterium]|jgi:hypothetical protein